MLCDNISEIFGVTHSNFGVETETFRWSSLRVIIKEKQESLMCSEHKASLQKLPITYPTKDAADLQQTLQDLKATQHLNLSAFCRAAIAEKLQRLQQQQEASK